MTVASDAKQKALGSGTAAAALRLPAFVAVKPAIVAVEPLPEMLSGAPPIRVNPIDKPVLVGKVAKSDVKVRFGAVAFRDTEFPLPEKTALVNFAVRKSTPVPPGRLVNSMVPE